MSMDRSTALRTAVILSWLAIAVGFASPEKAFSAENPAQSLSTGLYVKVRLAQSFKGSKLKPGETVAGTLARDVYAADHKLFSAGSMVQLTVDHLEKRRRTPNDHWPGVIQLFTPRHEKFPVFTKALIRQGEQETSLDVSLITVSRMRDVHAQAKKKKAGESEDPGAVQVSKENKTKSATPTLILEARNTEPANNVGERPSRGRTIASRAPNAAHWNPLQNPSARQCQRIQEQTRRYRASTAA